MKHRFLVALIAFVAMSGVLTAVGGERVPARAYYLFLAGAPQSCEDCYVPLLIAQQSLEEIAASRNDKQVVVLTTYERDSIWKVERNVPLVAGDIVVGQRMIRLQNRHYRYQEISAAEVIRLLEKPEGTIRIHRTLPAPGKKELEDLTAAFRERN